MKSQKNIMKKVKELEEGKTLFWDSWVRRQSKTLCERQIDDPREWCALLLAIKGDKQTLRDVAKALGIAYGTARNWAREKGVLQKRDYYVKQFAKQFCETMMDALQSEGEDGGLELLVEMKAYPIHLQRAIEARYDQEFEKALDRMFTLIQEEEPLGEKTTEIRRFLLVAVWDIDRLLQKQGSTNRDFMNIRRDRELLEKKVGRLISFYEHLVRKLLRGKPDKTLEWAFEFMFETLQRIMSKQTKIIEQLRKAYIKKGKGRGRKKKKNYN